MRGVVAVCASMLLLACQPGSAGPLDPVAAPGVQRVADERWGQAAIVRQGALSARIVGRWSSEGAQTLRVSYRNAGPAAVSVEVADLKLAQDTSVAALWTAVDATGIDLADARTDNNDAPVLYTLDHDATHAAALTIPPGTARAIDAAFTSFGKPVEAGAGIVATVPLGPRRTAVAFTAARPRWLW